jgi:type VI secretion system protein VasD
MSGACIARVGCAVVLLGLIACHSAPPPKPVEPPVITTLAIVTAPDVNPDKAGRASPVVVRLFQLRTDAEFGGAQFFRLYDGEKEALGASLIARDEFTMNPGAQRQQELPVAPETRYFAVLAAYQDPAAQWRAILPAPPPSAKKRSKEEHLTIHLNQTAVSLTLND